MNVQALVMILTALQASLPRGMAGLEVVEVCAGKHRLTGAMRSAFGMSVKAFDVGGLIL
jgi:hypothetical protein